jgi:hypothetical protein
MTATGTTTKGNDDGKKATAKLPTTIMPSARAVAKWIHPAATCACASKLVSHLAFLPLACEVADGTAVSPGMLFTTTVASYPAFLQLSSLTPNRS